MHDHVRDADCLRTVFGLPPAWLQLFGDVALAIPPAAPADAEDGALDEPPEDWVPFRVVDTQHALAVLARINYKVGLQRACRAARVVGVEPEAAHNATNDACWTLQLFLNICEDIKTERDAGLPSPAKKRKLDALASAPNRKRPRHQPAKKAALIIDVDSLEAGEDDALDVDAFAAAHGLKTSSSVVDLTQEPPTPARAQQAALRRPGGPSIAKLATRSDPICLE
jgi:hypothetical protein